MKGKTMEREESALMMLDVFLSVGAKHFDLTITSQAGEKLRFRRAMSSRELHRILPFQIRDCAGRNENVILRPHGEFVVFVQLDDLDETALKHIQPTSHVVLETSPRNFQAWIAMSREEATSDFIRRLRKGIHADPTASGATRVAGSHNFKDKYAPNFPIVQLISATRGLTTTQRELESLGLVEKPELKQGMSRSVLRPFHSGRSGKRGWPSYDRCVAGAPPTHDGNKTDISRADFTWCMTASSWGWPTEQIALRLMELSEKAQENGERYAVLTAEKAAAAADRNARAAG
jgi:hypothetical protein